MAAASCTHCGRSWVGTGPGAAQTIGQVADSTDVREFEPFGDSDL
jgi:hypothetical protein